MRRKILWLTSSVASLALLALVVAQVNWQSAKTIIDDINYLWVAVGIGLLIIEGLITAARFSLLAMTPVRFIDCLRATAWYVLLLIGLPARLGEIAGIAVIVKHMGQRTGAATASLLFQRLFDMIVLTAVLILICVLVTSENSELPMLFSIVAAMGLFTVVLCMDRLLAIAAQPFLRRRTEIWPRRILRLLLQVRMVSRHHFDRSRTLKLGGYTLAKWLVNLAAIGCIVSAVVPAMKSLTALGVGIVYNLSAVIPIQTIGGIGISESVLLGSFVWLGYSLEMGAPIAIAIRLALISAPILFWLFVMLLGRRRTTVFLDNKP